MMITAQFWNQIRRTMSPRDAVLHVMEALDAGHLNPATDFELREMAEGLVENGAEWVRAMNPRNPIVFESGAVNTTLFSYVSRAAITQRILDAYMHEEFVLARLVPTVTSRIEAEVVPGVQPIGDVSEIVGEAEYYPTAQFGEDWQRMPVAFKRGFIIPITREMIWADRWGMVMRMASTLGEYLGVRREKEIADTIIDNPRGSATGGMGNRMDWKGTQYATYDTGTNWTNSHSNELVNYSDIAASEALLDGMLDPFTGDPIVMAASQLLVTPAYKHVAGSLTSSSKIVDATERTATQLVYTERTNPYLGVGWAASRILYRRIINGGNAGTAVAAADAQKYWFYGDFAKAFKWLEHFPLRVDQLTGNSYMSFAQDIEVAFKTSYKGTAATEQPRAMVRSTN